MEAMAIVTILALLQFIFFTANVGQMRMKHGVKAPSTTGDSEFERAFRVQQNTMEQLVVVLPAMWIFGMFFNPLYAAGLGLVFIIGRFIYRASYLKDPATRANGFTIGVVAIFVMLFGGLVGAVMQLF